MKPGSESMKRASAFAVASTALVVLLPTSALGQVVGSLRGVVSSAATGEPVEGALVQIIGTMSATETDEDGRYALMSVPLGVSVIRITHRGHVALSERVEFEQAALQVRDFEMMAPEFVLDEVVAKAMRQADVPDNAIDDEELEGATSLREVLNQVSGVTLVRSGGAVGMGWFLRIRGAKSFRFNDPPVVWKSCVCDDTDVVQRCNRCLVDCETVDAVHFVRGTDRPANRSNAAAGSSGSAAAARS